MDATDHLLLAYSYVKRRTLFTYRQYNSSNEEDSRFHPLDPGRSITELIASASQERGRDSAEDAIEASLRCVTHHLQDVPPVLTNPKHYLRMRGTESV